MMPASPSRGRSDRFRFNRGYFRRRTRLKWINLLLFLLLVGGVTIYLLDHARLSSPGTPRPWSHGELSRVHAMWDNQCSACHVASSDQRESPLLATDERWNELRCNHCHGDAIHHQNMKWEAALADNTQRQCAVCHREHQGREHSLVQMADTTCVRCHENLPEHVEPIAGGVPKGTEFAAKITSFATDHPEFRKLDPSRPPHKRGLKFNHALHMSPGLVPRPASMEVDLPGGDAAAPAAGPRIEPSNVTRLKDLPPVYRSLYEDGNTDDAPLQLRCESCHQSDVAGLSALSILRAEGLPRNNVIPSRSSGAHMLPINYDLHCRGCHPMKLYGNGTGTEDESLRLPHRIQPEELKSWLTRYYNDFDRREPRGLEDAEVRADKHSKDVDAIGRDRVDRPNRKPAAVTEADRLIEKRVRERVDRDVVQDLKYLFAERALKGAGDSCVKCHELSKEWVEGTHPRAIEPTSIPSVWFEHARFDHASHR
ncbi:MAG: hypothetical protein IT428_08500, partial [Planctomycetaceae bacterium]|nr:hypothetical protein [Planctomycetaceae bacterium]